MRRWLLPAGAYVALTAALAFPLFTRFSAAFPHDAGDPVLNAWILWWSTRHVPLSSAWWNAPMFFPMANAMALSEVLIGLLPITAVVQWITANPVTAYNAAFVLSFPLCALAAFALAEELTGRRDAALAAGLAFMLAPYRMGQLSHLQMLSYYWAPVALLGLHRYLRDRRLKWLVVFAIAWLMQAISNGYALFHLSVLVVLWIVWFARPIRTAVPIALAWLLAAIPVIPLLWKYQQVHSALHLVRDINEVRRFGVDIADLIAAPPELALWGERLWPARPETAVFPGVTLLIVLAAWAFSTWRRPATGSAPRTSDEKVLVALSAVAALTAFSVYAIGPWSIGPLTVTDFHKPFSIAVGLRLLAFLRGPWMRRAWGDRSPAAFYAVAMIAMYLLALGPEPRLLGRPLLYEPPYAWLSRLPGFDVLRVPARFAMLAVLCQSMLLAYALARWATNAARATMIAGLICVGLVADGWVRMPVEAAPAAGPAWDGVDAVIELPLGEGTRDFGAIARSMSHGLPIANGYSGYDPPHYLPLVSAIHDGQYSALYEVAAGRTLGVAVDRSATDAPAIEAALGSMTGVGRGLPKGGWDFFIMRAPAHRDPPLGPEIRLQQVRTSAHTEDIGRLQDNHIETAWGSGPNQIGDEELTIDLGTPQPVGSLSLEMGAFAFGFPRALEIDTSIDGVNWAETWGGTLAALTVHAAVVDPGRVPVTIEIGPVPARFIRLRQTGSEPGIPWWIAELHVYVPAPASAPR